MLPVHEPPVEVPVKKSGREKGAKLGTTWGSHAVGWQVGEIWEVLTF